MQNEVSLLNGEGLINLIITRFLIFKVFKFLIVILSLSLSSHAVYMSRAFHRHNHMFMVYSLMGPSLAQVLVSFLFLCKQSLINK